LYDGEVRALTLLHIKTSSPKDNSLIKEISQNKGSGVLLYDGEVMAL
jgi:hypothetical protein